MTPELDSFSSLLLLLLMLLKILLSCLHVRFRGRQAGGGEVQRCARTRELSRVSGNALATCVETKNAWLAG